MTHEPKPAWSDFSLEEQAAVTEQSLLDCCRFCLATSEGTKVEDDASGLWFRSGIPFPIYNGMYGIRETEHVIERLDICKRERIPQVACIGPGSEGLNLHTLFKEYGLMKAGGAPGMGMSLDNLPATMPLPPGATVEPVETEAQLQEWVEVQNTCFQFPQWVKEATFRLTANTLTQDPDTKRVWMFLGRFFGTPVATSMLVLSDDVAGVYNVTCLPEAGRRGMGTAMTMAALLAGRDAGFRSGVLQATPKSKAMYEKIGFEEVCHFTHWLQASWTQIASFAIVGLFKQIGSGLRPFTHKLPSQQTLTT